MTLGQPDRIVQVRVGFLIVFPELDVAIAVRFRNFSWSTLDLMP